MRIVQLPAFEDNYLYLLMDGRQVAAVDPGDPQVILDFLCQNHLPLHYILSTHHHLDHVGGNEILKEKTGCKVIGFSGDSKRIPGMDQGVIEGDTLTIGNAVIQVLETPGHTTGHISYFIPSLPALFCGDTLFSMGCGRIFEGNPEALWMSLQKIKTLPPETQIYCAHEYTETNTRFALFLEPNNQRFKEKLNVVQKFEMQGAATVPSRLLDECALNPFLRVESLESFINIRKLKDSFQ